MTTPVAHPDACPTCHRRITDTDPNGCELSTGQRYCLTHLTAAACADPEDAPLWQAWVLSLVESEQLDEKTAHATYISGALPRATYIATVARLHAERSAVCGLSMCHCLACVETDQSRRNRASA